MNTNIAEFLTKTGLANATRSIHTFYGILEDVVGKEYMEEVRAFIEARADGVESEDSNYKFYALKNRTLDTALLITGLFDRGIIAPTCQFIQDNSDKFGKTILDIGCDIGIVTCFIATEHPDSKIVGIDINESSIKVAKELAEKLNIQNVEFLCIDMQDYHPEEQFDTVFTSRTLQEIMDDKKDFDYVPFDPLYKVEQYRNMFSPVTIASSFVKDDGYYLAVERANVQIYTNTYFVVLSDAGFLIDYSLSDKLLVASMADEERLQKVVAIKNHKQYSASDVIRKNMFIALKGINFTENQYYYDAACVLFWGDVKELVQGLIGYSKKSGEIQVLLLALKSKSDSDAVYRFFYRKDVTCYMERHYARDLNDMIDMNEFDMNNFKHELKLKVVPFPGNDKDKFNYRFLR